MDKSQDEIGELASNRLAWEQVFYAFALSGPYRELPNIKSLRLAPHTVLLVLRSLITSWVSLSRSSGDADLIDAAFSCSQELPKSLENDHAALNVNAEQKLQRELSVEERIEQYAAIKNKQFFGIGDALGFLLASISADAFSPTMDSSDFAHIALSTADGLLAKHPKRSEFLAWMNSSTKDSRSVSQRNLGLSFGLLSYFGQSKDWSFWSEWYQGFLDGKPMDWELQRRVALIDDHFWEAGPEAVAEEIERIRTRYDVETALNDLAEAQSVVQRSRRGIGGNNPPEAIEDAPVLERHVKLIWNGVDILAEEVKAEEPDKARVEAALGMLKTGLAACLKWCGRKGDLAVDTLIKWGVPVGASGYLALNPDKVRALIEAVEAWVPFL